MNAFINPPFLVLLFLLIAISTAAAWFGLDIHKKVKKFLGATGMDTDGDIAHGLMRRVARLEAKSEETDPRLVVLERIAASSIQKVGFVRFNPFQDTGGDNSFILVLLDRNDTGVLLSSLYMREGARMYAKAIEKGRPKHMLSAEENKILEETLQS